MKRFVSLLAALLMFSTLFIGVTARPAHAEWIQEEVGWRISSVGSPYSGTAIYVRDTTHQALNVDTTSTFSLDKACPLPRGFAGFTNAGATQSMLYNGLAATAPNDTTVVAWLLVQSDSSATPSSGITSLGVLLDGRAAPLGPAVSLARGWVKVDSIPVLTAAPPSQGTVTGDETIAIPIRSIGTYGKVFAFKNLRARITAAGTTLGAARVYVRYWVP